MSIKEKITDFRIRANKTNKEYQRVLRFLKSGHGDETILASKEFKDFANSQKEVKGILGRQKYSIEKSTLIMTAIAAEKMTRMLLSLYDSLEVPEGDTPSVQLTIADEYYKEELRHSIIYSVVLASAFLIQSLFVSHQFYGTHLILVVLACVVIGRICLIKYRISKEFFGSSSHEARLLIQYIIDNSEKFDPPDDGSMSVFPTYTGNKEAASQKDLELGGELA